MYKVFISIHGELICCLILKVFDEIRELKVLHFCFSIKMDKEKIQYLQYIHFLYFFLSFNNMTTHLSVSRSHRVHSIHMCGNKESSGDDCISSWFCSWTYIPAFRSEGRIQELVEGWLHGGREVR